MNKQDVIDLIKDTGYGCLSTMEGNQPRVRPMLPYLTEDGNLLIAVLSRSRTIEQIKKNPLVEMCYIDRKMWYARVTGKAQINTDMDKKQQAWDNIPMLRQYFSGPEDPNFVLIEVETTQVEAMTPHENQPTKISLK